MDMRGRLVVDANGDEPSEAFRRSLDGIAYERLPEVLASAHRLASPGDTLVAELTLGTAGGHSRSSDASSPDPSALLTGAGFDETSPSRRPREIGDQFRLEGIRLQTLPDYVAPDLSVLICGLNPSVHSADMGVGFGRRGNRFWPAALAAGLVSVDRDPVDALTRHHVGMTDLVKRATPRAATLTRDEYASGVERLTVLCRWLRPRLVCMVGLAGWRATVDRRAEAGPQTRTLGGSAVYVMPSTSGLNTHSSLADLTAHLTRAADLAAVTDRRP